MQQATTARNSRGPWLVSPDQRRMGLTPKLWPSLGQESCHFTQQQQQQDSGRMLLVACSSDIQSAPGCRAQA